MSNATQKVRTALGQPRLSESTKEAGWMAYGKLSGLAALQATKGKTTSPEHLGYVISSFLLLKDEKLSIVGEHSPIVFGSGEIAIQNSIIVFDGIDLEAQQPYYAALHVLGSGSSVVVRNGNVQNLDQTLDGITWINVEFQHSMIRTRGGPFVLVNVTFRDCDFRWLGPPLAGQVGLDLRERIDKANGQPITFAYEGNPPPSTSQPLLPHP